MTEQGKALYDNWSSRKETLEAIYKRMIAIGDKLPPDEAVLYTQPLCDTMLLVLSNMDNRKNENDVDNLLNDIFSSV